MDKVINEENFNQEIFEGEVEQITETKSEEVKPESPAEGVTEVPETQEPEIPEGVDNPKSYKHFQKIAEERKLEIEKERQARELAEARIREYEEKSKVSQEVLKPPVKPERPADYNPSDIYDVNSSTFKYEVAYRQYLEDKDAYRDSEVNKVSTTIQQQQEKERLAQYWQAHRTEWTTKFLAIPGATPEKAARAYDDFINGDSATPENLYTLSLLRHGEYTPKPKAEKKDKINTILPPGVTSGGDAESLKSPDDMFSESIKTTNSGSWI